MRLGDILVEDGVISRDVLETHTPHVTSRLGDYLRASTSIGERAIARAIARQHALPFSTFTNAPPDDRLFNTALLDEYIKKCYVPYRLSGNQLTIATPEPSAALVAHVAQQSGFRITQLVITPRDLNHYIRTRAATSLTRRARLHLKRRYPFMIASHVLSNLQRRGFLLLLLLLAAAFFVIPETTWYLLLVACNIFYFTTLAFKLQLYLQGRAAQHEMNHLQPLLDCDIAALHDRDLPIYTLLIPLYKEPSHVIEHALRHIAALEYPKEKLDVKLILEADDLATWRILTALHPPDYIDIVRVPPSRPRTKPKACNVALQQIRGEVVVIFDAEDAPEPQQLKRAIAYFARAGNDVACLQAPLNYYNRDENVLTQLFAIEYSTLFHVLLPALERMALPIPLGGTSNHIKRTALETMGGWDAFNVTEDADLGIRLAYLQQRTRILPSITLEEAPITLAAWMKQRTRWIKGYIQTWLVYMRDPPELRRRLGLRGYYGFQLFIGAPALTYLLAPFFWLVFILAVFELVPVALSPMMLGLCLISLIGGMVSHWLFARSVIAYEKWRMPLALLIFPLYWLLHSLASFRALWQLATAPHYWDKTRHGVSKKLKGLLAN